MSALILHRIDEPADGREYFAPPPGANPTYCREPDGRWYEITAEGEPLVLVEPPEQAVRESFFCDTDRLAFDSRLTAADGWAQLDTGQDAPYYGNWANPLKLELAEYAEGDFKRTTFSSSAAFARGCRKSLDWALENTGMAGLDPGLGDSAETIKAAFTGLGISMEYRRAAR